MVMNLVDLKQCIKLAVMDPLDHRNLVNIYKRKKGGKGKLINGQNVGFRCRLFQDKTKYNREFSRLYLVELSTSFFKEQ